MGRRRPVWIWCLAAAALTVAGAGFGAGHGAREDSRSATQIFKDALAATLHAGSVHYAGYVDSAGSSVSLNIAITPTRSGGTVTDKGATLKVVVTKTEVYIEADQASWQKLTGSSAEAQLLADRWLKAPVSNTDFASFVGFTNLSQLFSPTTSPGVLTKGKTTSFAGQAVVPVTSSKGGTIDVADSGAPYILRLVKTGGAATGTGQFVFNQYGHAHPPALPKNAVDFGSLAGAG